ncbi:hypothetical protein D1872_250360 [compost metagenome]
MPTDKDQMLFPRQLLCLLLGKRIPLRAHQNDAWLSSSLSTRILLFIRLLACQQILHGGEYRIWLEHHPSTTAIGRIIDGIMLVRCVGPEINCLQ